MNNYVCTLGIRRNLYPLTTWHWAVETPSGHVFQVSKTNFESAAEAIADAAIFGLSALDTCERAQAQHNPDFAAVTGLPCSNTKTREFRYREIGEAIQATDEVIGYDDTHWERVPQHLIGKCVWSDYQMAGNLKFRYQV